MYGHPLVADLLNLSGFNRSYFKVHGTHLNRVTVMYAFFDAISKNMTPRMHCEKLGKKHYEV